ncbi:uncharacterized protein LOC103718451 isoform X1 [Phoenix dactylifera]|uniref:Uncharacterized protein LOC103718451 isoform X1 n=2 Tax=Phoenix dactylifera TaxID=42345 RepID=A0A8B7CT62_PHODC|nr:uncharacterized protein LOC103718451 isoform X1 [Phoenix dactylifera]
MNFLLRTAHPVASDLHSAPEAKHQKDVRPTQKQATTLEGLIAEDLFPNSLTEEDDDKDGDGVGDAGGETQGSENQVACGNLTDVTEDEGWITIPYKELPDNWSDAPDILQLRLLDRSFIFPGEQIHILVCLSAAKQDTEIITPFRVAAVMSKNGKSSQNGNQQTKIVGIKSRDANGTHEETVHQNIKDNGETISTGNEMTPRRVISATKSLLRMEDHKQQTENLLERFRNSNFFVRIAQLDEPLWSKRNVAEQSSVNSEMAGERFQSIGGSLNMSTSLLNAVVDKGNFGGNTSGGLARDTVKCYSLRNGDIVVLLQVNVGIGIIKDPVLEILQFEKDQASNSVSENLSSSPVPNSEDPCHDLLRWLLPLDRTLPPSRPLSPPLSSSISQKTNLSSSSQIFSFGHFRSYSMPSLPQVTGPPSSAVPPSNSRPAFDLEDFDRFSPEKQIRSRDMGNAGILSFRGVSLEPERFSVRCGLEGIYLPGRRWRRKLEIIQPLEIRSFAAECITEDFICVQIKNVMPAHIPDSIIFLDAITVVFEEASKEGPSVSLPVACTETGNGHSLPNLALRRGEEHSFILKPATTLNRDFRGNGETNSMQPHSKMGTMVPNVHMISRSADQYAILVSCRCNYTESKLFFKQLTDWRPRIARDLMITVAPESYQQTIRANAKAPHLPVQVLTLKATNLTSEDLTLTVLAPESSTSSPTVLSLNSSPKAPMDPFISFHEYMGRMGGDKLGIRTHRLSSMPASTESQKVSDSGGIRSSSLEHWTDSMSHVISSNDSGCTHLWLQSTVPLGCVPAHSNATVKLELLPLTDGIVTLDTLQIAVKEKGLTYIPEYSLKIYATSSIATGIL